MLRATLSLLRWCDPLLLYAAVAIVCITSEISAAECDRKSFGQFIQFQNMDTRARVLERASESEVTFRKVVGGTKLIADSGLWTDQFTGKMFTDADQLEIDHVIPMCWAWSRGASQWDDEAKRDFFNDMDLLIPVESAFNKIKSDDGLDQFMPKDQELACKYARRFIAGMKKKDEIKISSREQDELENILDLACDRMTSYFVRN